MCLSESTWIHPGTGDGQITRGFIPIDGHVDIPLTYQIPLHMFEPFW